MKHWFVPNFQGIHFKNNSMRCFKVIQKRGVLSLIRKGNSESSIKSNLFLFEAAKITRIYIIDITQIVRFELFVIQFEALQKVELAKKNVDCCPFLKYRAQCQSVVICASKNIPASVNGYSLGGKEGILTFLLHILLYFQNFCIVGTWHISILLL